jgi:hypothetical protein
VSVHRFAVIDSVSVVIDNVAQDPFGDRGLVCRQTWTVHFIDGEKFEMPTEDGRQEAADRLAAAILAGLRSHTVAQEAALS